jgi:ABC-type sugar transport system ATPase subunit
LQIAEPLLMPSIEIRGLSKAYRAGVRALDAVDLDVAAGELLVLVGASGSGKTTLLRLVAGLEQPTAGSICIGGKDLAGVPPHRRNVALVFQSLALYSHLTVGGNLAFGLRYGRFEPGASGARGGMPEPEAGQRVLETAEMLGITGLLDRHPAELSGGEQQRVALGRAIIRRPAALLLDEPLSSLDTRLRRSLRGELKRLQRRLGVPTVYVTHDEEDARSLADRVAVLDRGRLVRDGSANDVLDEAPPEACLPASVECDGFSPMPARRDACQAS